MPRRRLSIAEIVILLLVGATTVLLGTLAVIGYSSYRDRQREEFARKHAAIADQLATSLTLPLWNFDRGQIGKVIESAMQDDEVYGIVARSTGEVPVQHVRTRDAAWKVAAGGGKFAAGGLVVEKRPVAVAGDTVGVVEVFATTRFLETRLRQTLFAIVGVIGFLDLILVVGLYLLLWRTVLRPLREVEQRALALTQGDAPRESPRRRRYPGELESLQSSLEKMIGLLGARYEELQRSESAHRRLAESLRESEEKFSKVFHSAPDAMAITEAETGRCLDANEGFRRHFGFGRAALLGKTALDLGIWSDEASRSRFVALLQARGAVRDFEIDHRNARGEAVSYLVSAERLTLGGGSYILSVFHDITDRKRAAERDRQAREEFTRRLIASQEAERRRIAGELHDSLGQNLLLIKNRAQLALAAAGLPPEFRRQLESMQDMAAQAIAEVRQISHDLRPYQLDQLGLTRALASMIDGAARNTALHFTHQLDAVDDLFAPEAATNLYRVVQESLNNILHHARAAHAHVTLERDVRQVRLEIADDGCGFAPGEGAPASRKEGGLGLANIAERVRIVNGTLRIDSAPGRGTRLEVTIPLPDEP
jgi:PAS domain S-box-containing protein